MAAGTAFAQIEEIVVTAQKRPENIQDVPISMSAFSADFLESSGIRSGSLYT
jgi:iron complex outermembrane receptor protein